MICREENVKWACFDNITVKLFSNGNDAASGCGVAIMAQTCSSDRIGN
jgi:hypothetical protein